ncbi:Protein of unknown function [Weissella confusa LBAE C39-2]|nr:Protein of unknown function [Weissella confusa LBAE C39-2]
MTRKDKQTK